MVLCIAMVVAFVVTSQFVDKHSKALSRTASLPCFFQGLVFFNTKIMPGSLGETLFLKKRNEKVIQS